MSGGGDDPFGRKDEEPTDAFGRPITDDAGGGSLWSSPADQAEEAARSAPPPTHGGFAPPTDAPPDTSTWWAESQAGTSERRDHGAPVAGTAPAEWPERAGAAVLDFLIRIAIIGAAMLVGALGYLGSSSAGDAGLTIGFILGAVAGIAYAPYMIAKRNGQTVGHRVAGIRVVGRSGGGVSGGRAFVREVLVKGILFEGILGSLTFGIGTAINYLWPLWDDKNEALHDKMCDTRVFKA